MITLINAPSILGLRPTGVELLPESLWHAGLNKKLHLKASTTVSPPRYNAQRDIQTKMLNPQALAEYSVSLADAVQKAVESHTFPLVLGGDCSIILGNMLALKRIGRYGLFFLDGHADFYQPEASETGEAADMDLALATGRGPAVVTNVEDQKPLVKDSHVVQFGQRDKKETAEYGSQQIADTDIHVFELETIRQKGVQESCKAALAALLDQPIEGFWVHIDADVIDDSEMPAVDYRMPGGLTFAELESVLEIILSTDKAVGLDLAIYNPALDPDKKMAARLADLLANALRMK